MEGARSRQPERPKVFKSKLDDPVNIRRSVIRVSLVILLLLGLVALSGWWTFGTQAQSYTIKVKNVFFLQLTALSRTEV